MFLALGVGAYGVAIFHLYTHAFFKACLFLGAGQRDPRARRRAGRAQDGRAGAQDPGHVRRPSPSPPPRSPACRRSPASSPRTRSSGSPREQPRRLAAALARRRGDGADDGVLHVPPALAHVPRPLAHDAGGRAPRARVAASMTGVLVVLAVLSARRRLHRRAALPRAAAAAAGGRRAAACTTRRRCSSVSVALALAGLAGAAYLFGGGADARRAPCAALRRRCTAWLCGKYFIDELVRRRCSAGRCVWISDRVFLRFGDRALLDGTLHGLAGARPRRRRRVRPRADRQPPSLRLVRARRHRRRAALELASCLTPRCSTSSSSCRCSASACSSARGARSGASCAGWHSP